ncbi:MAG: hypothetical protein MJY98_02165 [Fibrobacter sp.]|nr:hypothetical protein [Fibrobacter sp.]
MAENLNYDLGDVSDLGDYAWHGCYGNISDNCEKYGRLYTRDAVENYVQCDEKKCRYGVCPEGWHFPSIEELKLLEGVVAGPVEKAMRVTSWSNGSDTFGLSALPAGCRSNSGGFEGLGSETYWWTAWDSRDNMAFSWFLTSNNAYPDSYKGDSYYDRNKAYSVRCLKDSD